MPPINRLRVTLAFVGYAGIGAMVAFIVARILFPEPLKLAIWAGGGAVAGLAVCAVYVSHLLRVRKRMINAEKG